MLNLKHYIQIQKTINRVNPPHNLKFGLLKSDMILAINCFVFQLVYMAGSNACVSSTTTTTPVAKLLSGSQRRSHLPEWSPLRKLPPSLSSSVLGDRFPLVSSSNGRRLEADTRFTCARGCSELKGIISHFFFFLSPPHLSDGRRHQVFVCMGLK